MFSTHNFFCKNPKVTKSRCLTCKLSTFIHKKFKFFVDKCGINLKTRGYFNKKMFECEYCKKTYKTHTILNVHQKNGKKVFNITWINN